MRFLERVSARFPGGGGERRREGPSRVPRPSQSRPRLGDLRLLPAPGGSCGLLPMAEPVGRERAAVCPPASRRELPVQSDADTQGRQLPRLCSRGFETPQGSSALPAETCPRPVPSLRSSRDVSPGCSSRLVCDRLLPTCPLTQVLLTLVASPHVYTDKVSDSVQEAGALQAAAAGQDADDASIPVSHIDGRRRALSRGGALGAAGVGCSGGQRRVPRHQRPACRGHANRPACPRGTGVCRACARRSRRLCAPLTGCRCQPSPARAVCVSPPNQPSEGTVTVVTACGQGRRVGKAAVWAPPCRGSSDPGRSPGLQPAAPRTCPPCWAPHSVQHGPRERLSAHLPARVLFPSLWGSCGPNAGSDVLHMVDVLVEGSEGLDEEVGVALSEDTALLSFPFSAVVPAALEARNKLLLGAEGGAGSAVGGMAWLRRPLGSVYRGEGHQGLWKPLLKPPQWEPQAEHGGQGAWGRAGQPAHGTEGWPRQRVCCRHCRSFRCWFGTLRPRCQSQCLRGAPAPQTRGGAPSTRRDSSGCSGCCSRHEAPAHQRFRESVSS